MAKKVKLKSLKNKIKGDVYVGNETEKLKRELQLKTDSLILTKDSLKMKKDELRSTRDSLRKLQSENDSLKQVIKIRINNN